MPVTLPSLRVRDLVKNPLKEHMEENTNDISETTEAESESADQTDLEESSEDSTSETTSEETITTEESKPQDTRANKRIREVIAERNEWRDKYYQATQSQPQTDGIDPDGIDPKAFRQSIKSEIMAEQSQKNLDKNDRFLVAQAIKDFDFMKEKVWQEEASDYVKKGYDPYTAAQMVEQKISYLRGVEKEKFVKQAKADQKLRSNAYTPSGSQQNMTNEFTQEDIAQMSTAEYEKNRAKIFKQFGIRA